MSFVQHSVFVEVQGYDCGTEGEVEDLVLAMAQGLRTDMTEVSSLPATTTSGERREVAHEQKLRALGDSLRLVRVSGRAFVLIWPPEADARGQAEVCESTFYRLRHERERSGWKCDRSKRLLLDWNWQGHGSAEWLEQVRPERFPLIDPAEITLRGVRVRKADPDDPAPYREACWEIPGCNLRVWMGPMERQTIDELATDLACPEEGDSWSDTDDSILALGRQGDTVWFVGGGFRFSSDLLRFLPDGDVAAYDLWFRLPYGRHRALVDALILAWRQAEASGG